MTATKAKDKDKLSDNEKQLQSTGDARYIIAYGVIQNLIAFRLESNNFHHSLYLCNKHTKPTK